MPHAPDLGRVALAVLAAEALRALEHVAPELAASVVGRTPGPGYDVTDVAALAIAAEPNEDLVKVVERLRARADATPRTVPIQAD